MNYMNLIYTFLVALIRFVQHFVQGGLAVILQPFLFVAYFLGLRYIIVKVMKN